MTDHSAGASTEVTLILGSALRSEVLERFLDSLGRQRHGAFRLTVVEQRDPAGAEALAARHRDLDVTVRTSAPGLSRARNVALDPVPDGIIGFPDDDCWYLPGTLSRVCHRFAADPELAILCGRVLTPTGPMLRYPDRAGPIDRRNVWRTVVSPGLFVRSAAMTAIGPFDPRLGVGAGTGLGSGEETDVVLRGLRLGLKCEYDPLLHVSHPSPDQVPHRLDPGVGYSYGYGMGHVLRAHRYGWPTIGGHVLRPLVGGIAARIGGKVGLSAFRIAVARGRLNGARRYPDEPSGTEHAPA